MSQIVTRERLAFEGGPPQSVVRNQINLHMVAAAVTLADIVLLGSTAVWAVWIIGLAGSDGYREAAALNTVAVMGLFVRSFNKTIDEFFRTTLVQRVIHVEQRLVVPFLLSLAVNLLSGGLSTPLLAWDGLWLTLASAGVALVRIGLEVSLDRWRSRDVLRQHIAIVGGGPLAARLVEQLQRDCADTVRIVGVFDDRVGRQEFDGVLAPYWRGGTDHLLELAKIEAVNRVLIALPHSAEERLAELMAKFKRLPADICLAPDRAGFLAAGGGPDITGLPLVTVYGRPMEPGARLIKDLVDKTFALGMLLLVSPILAVAALAIRLESPGPVLFWQERYGLGGRVIRVAKLRSMYADQTDAGGAQQTRRVDSRVTRVGNFLRRTSIDELPQLLNVLRGDMSIVGPRPLPLQMRVQDRMNHEIVSNYADRHRIKPGLTGWAQVNGLRGAVDTPDDLHRRIALDLYYIDNWSLWLDFKIMLLTARVLFAHPNVY